MADLVKVSVRLDCGTAAPIGARTYEVSGRRVLHDGRSIDAFETRYTAMRDAVARGDYRLATALFAHDPNARPFVLRHLLLTLPDDDAR